jgi:hypothetical protein
MFADNMALSRYETFELDVLLAQIERPNPWLLRTFFRRERLFGTRTIEFDMIDKGRRLAPFVSPLVAGKPTRREGFRTVQLAPAYIKPLDIVHPTDTFTRLPGEGYGGTMTAQQRFDRLVAEKMDLHMEVIDNRMEWMAAQALVLGGITIEGEDYPTQYVDFGRAAGLNYALVGGAKWDQLTATPVEDLETACLNVRVTSKGAVVDTIVMDGATWSILKKNASVQELLDVRFRRHLLGQTETAIDQGPRTNINEAVYVGTLSGRLDLWVYDAFYEDDTGTSQPYLPPYTVIGVATAALEGTQYFGAILDMDANIEPRKTFTKSKPKWNPSGLELLTQSAPLVGPRRPNAMFKMVVK